MNLTEIEKLVSRKQIISIVESRSYTLALWSGSVSAGKTVASLFEFLIAILNAPSTGIIIITGKTSNTIYQNIFLLLQNRAIFGTLSDQVHYTPGANRAFILGREVQVIGANNRDAVGRIQGATVALAYVDEAAILPEEFWNMLVSRLRVVGARLLATMNPASLNHWIRKKWILKAADKDLVHFHFTMEDNPALPAEYVERMKRSYSGVFYDRMIKGIWTNAAGAVFPMWNPDKHVIPFDLMPEITEIIGVGMDYGTTNASTGLMLGISHKPVPKLILMDEWGYDPTEHNNIRLTDSELSKNFQQWLRKPHTPYPSVLQPRFYMLDPAAASFHQQLFKDGITAWAADNSVLPGIATIANLLENEQLVVTDRCTGWQSEITEYQWDEKATAEGQDAVIKENDHYLDGGRYITHSTKNIWDYQLTA